MTICKHYLQVEKTKYEIIARQQSQLCKNMPAFGQILEENIKMWQQLLYCYGEIMRQTCSI